MKGECISAQPRIMFNIRWMWGAAQVDHAPCVSNKFACMCLWHCHSQVLTLLVKRCEKIVRLVCVPDLKGFHDCRQVRAAGPVW